jgi:Protein of unknown function (DUF1176)
VQQIGDWVVGCDNLAGCSMIGFPSADRSSANGITALPEMALRIDVPARADEQPNVEIFPVAEGAWVRSPATHASYRFNLSANGRVSDARVGYTPTILPQAEADFLLVSLEKGMTISGVDTGTGQTVVRFPGARFKAAMRAMQARRAALQKELADKALDELPGELPDGSAMPVAQPPRRIRAVETMVSGFVPILNEGRCNHDFMIRPRQFRFANGAVLWSFACERGDGRDHSLWDMAPSPEDVVEPVVLPEPRLGQVRAGVDGLENAAFDWDFGVLRSYSHPAGREDCGTMWAWGFTTNGWQLLERREMPLCRSMLPDRWIRTHAPVPGGPEVPASDESRRSE